MSKHPHITKQTHTRTQNITVRLKVLAHSVRMKHNFQGLPFGLSVMGLVKMNY